MTKLASPKQVGYIRNLVEARSSQFPAGADAFVEAIEKNRLTGRGAGVAIDALLAMPEDQKAPVEGSTRDPNRRANRYPGHCILCGHEVDAEAGYLVKDANGKWAAEHLAGECITGEVAKPKHKISEIVGELPDGYYAIPSWTGHNDISFFRIGTNKGVYDPSKKGNRYVRQVTGHHGEGGVERLNMETIGKLMAAINGYGVVESQALYGKEIGKCGVCGRTLTDEISRERGIGPDCWARVGA